MHTSSTQIAPGRFSSYLALVSFLGGTLLLILHLIFPNSIDIVIIGFLYVIMSALLNGIVFINLLYRFAMQPFYRETIGIRILILLANIPVVLLYLNIVLHNQLF